MLNFWRKNRKELIDKKRMRKYLLYSLGEIVLIVVGILIALYFNNLNTNRQQSELELKYYERLLVDLKSEKASLFKSKYAMNLQRRCMTDHLKYFYEQKAYDVDSLITTGGCILVDFPGFTAPRITLRELEQTGNLNLLKIDGVKESIINLSYTYEEIEWRERAEREKLDRIYSSLLTDGVIMMNQAVSLKEDGNGGIDRRLNDLEVKRWFMDVKNNHFVAYENYILMKDLSFTMRENLYRRVEAQIDTLINIIEERL